MNAQKNKCPECGGITLYKTTAQAAGGHGPAFLPGLGGFLRFAKFEIIACASCGLTRFYAEPSACDKLPRARRWQRL